MKTLSTSYVWIICCAWIAGVGCAGAVTDDSEGSSIEPGAAQVEPSVIAGSLLARVDLTETHYVEFRELGRGELSVLEQHHADLDNGAVATDFDPTKQSVAAFYKELAGDAAKPQELTALREFERRALPFDQAAPPASPPSQREIAEAFVDKAAEPPGWNFPGEIGWFSSNFCRVNTTLDDCLINLERFNEVNVVNGVRAVLFNQDFSVEAKMFLNFDPCFGGPFNVFCTKPFKNLQLLRLAPRTVLGSSTWTNKNRYQVFAEGRHFGIFVDWI